MRDDHDLIGVGTDADEAEPEVDGAAQDAMAHPVQARVQGMVDRQTDRACPLAQLVRVPVGGDAPPDQQAPDPHPGNITLEVGAGQCPAHLAPTDLDR